MPYYGACFFLLFAVTIDIKKSLLRRVCYDNVMNISYDNGVIRADWALVDFFICFLDKILI